MPHDSSHQHVDEKHRLAAVSQQRAQSEKRIAYHEHEIDHHQEQMLANAREFSDLLDIHNVSYSTVDGLETVVFVITDQLEKSRFYMTTGMISLGLAIGLGWYFSSLSFAIDSHSLLVAVVVALAIGVHASAAVGLHAIFDTGPRNPSSASRLKIVIGVSVAVLLVSFGLFMYGRFYPYSWIAFQLPGIMTSIELGLLLISGACHCLHLIYRWSDRLYRRHRGLFKNLTTQQHALDAEKTKLVGIQHKTNLNNEDGHLHDALPLTSVERHVLTNHDTTSAGQNGHSDIVHGNHIPSHHHGSPDEARHIESGPLSKTSNGNAKEHKHDEHRIPVTA